MCNPSTSAAVEAQDVLYSLNMRTTIQIYRSLLKYLNAMDAESVANGGPPEDPSIDAHFRSGVYLGAGMSTLILSLLPTKLLTIVEIFGYKGDRVEALELLGRAGGWSKDSDEPGVSAGKSFSPQAPVKG